MSFANQTICVTGGASGIGQAIATDFASKGGNICLMDVNAESLKDTENAIVNKHRIGFEGFSTKGLHIRNQSISYMG